MSKTSSMKELLEFQKKYKLGDVLGEGNFSVVRKCFTKAGDQSMYAVKVVKLKGNKEKKEDIKTMLQSEVAVMQKINNRNIIKCIDAFFGSDEIMVVLEGTAVCTYCLRLTCSLSETAIQILYFLGGFLTINL